jgi:hypothetical protein
LVKYNIEEGLWGIGVVGLVEVFDEGMARLLGGGDLLCDLDVGVCWILLGDIDILVEGISDKFIGIELFLKVRFTDIACAEAMIFLFIEIP